MNKEINDGGRAFPRPASEYTKRGTLQDGNDAVVEQDGMTLRDYFAAKAFQACIQAGKVNEYEDQKANGCINWCYDLADKMIMARKLE